ncbi:hypothetical protein ACR77J_13820 [Tissierella praeacuta]|uniref:hypothetical protein n=1 Tax=Tissierella praeacuta TaxID=43131 RepID=UPI003DA637E1
MIVSALALNIYLCKGYLVGTKIKEKTYQLGKQLTNDKVEDYIKFVDSIQIQPSRYHWNMIQAGYEIVKMNKDIEANLAEQLKISILSKGILVR